MGRLIDASVFDEMTIQGKSEEFVNGAKYILDLIDAQPTAYDVEEIKALKEKNEPKKPIFKFEYKDGRQFYDCPVCGAYVMHAGVQDKEKYCSNCGQKLDWNE